MDGSGLGKPTCAVGNYEIRGIIGKGSFSEVRLGYNRVQGSYSAIKCVNKKKLIENNLIERFETEIKVCRNMKHPGVVELIDMMQDEDWYYVVMEFCPHGELFQYIVEKRYLKEDEAKTKTRQILESLQYIHNHRVAHRDLKPENLLIDKYGMLKISDFGLSRFLPEDSLLSTPCGSPCYASPECISGDKYDGKKSDLWSVGVILYAMVSGQLPWTKGNQNHIFEQIKAGSYAIPKHISHNCADFLCGLMSVEANKRMTIAEAFNHPWMAKVPVQYAPSSDERPFFSLKKIDAFFTHDVYSPLPSFYKTSESSRIDGFDGSLRILKGNLGPKRNSCPNNVFGLEKIVCIPENVHVSQTKRRPSINKLRQGPIESLNLSRMQNEKKFLMFSKLAPSVRSRSIAKTRSKL